MSYLLRACLVNLRCEICSNYVKYDIFAMMASLYKHKKGVAYMPPHTSSYIAFTELWINMSLSLSG
jgi:hypothetical protein